MTKEQKFYYKLGQAVTNIACMLAVDLVFVGILVHAILF